MARVKLSKLAKPATGLIATLFLLLGLTALRPAASAATLDYWPLIVQGVDCDADPNLDPNAGCVPSDGIDILVTGEGENFYGSCTLSPVTSPNGGTFSACTVPVPFGVTAIVSEDLSTVPAGYLPLDNPQFFTTPDGPPEGEQGADVLFQNVLQGGSQPQNALIGLQIGVSNCETDPPCVGGDGVTVVVTGEGEVYYGSCVTEPAVGEAWLAACTVDVPTNATVIVSEDLSTVPAGYVPEENPIIATPPYNNEGMGLDVIFRNYAQGGEGNGDQGDEFVPIAIVGEHPAGIYTGSCENLGQLAAPLGTLTAPVGDHLGQATAAIAATSIADVDILLDNLLAEPYAIAVFDSGAPDADLIACGDLGAVADGDGQAAIGLLEMNDSGFTGIAYLATYANGPHPTAVSLFLFENPT